LQIDAHVGGVNDLAFSYPNKQLCVVTCGDDKLIKVRARKEAGSAFIFVNLMGFSFSLNL
jgi:WD40 repeat protein